MKNFSHFLAFIFIWIISDPVAFSQDFFLLSGNSRTLVTGFYEKKTRETDSFYYFTKGKSLKRNIYRHFRFENYNLQTREKISAFRISVETKKELDTVFISPDGRNLLLDFGTRQIVCDSRSGRIIGDYDHLRHTNVQGKKLRNYFSAEKQICFSNFDNQYLVATDTRLKAFDCFSGTEFFEYQGLSPFTRIENLFFTPDDKYIIAQDDKKYFYIWRTGQKTLLKKITADEITYSRERKTISLLRKTPTDLNVHVYRLTDLKRISKLNSRQELKRLAYTQMKVNQKYSSISNYGTYSLLFFENAEKAEILIYNNISGKQVYKIPAEKFKNELKIGCNGNNFNIARNESFSLDWLNDSLLLISINRFQKLMINVNTGLLLGIADYRVKEAGNNMISGIISPDYALVALPVKRIFSGKIFIKNALIENKEKYVNDAEFLTFSPDSRIILMKDLNGRPAFIFSSDIAARSGSKEIMKKYFLDTITEFHETRIAKAGTRPDGYVYSRIKENKHIKDLRNDLNISLKAVSSSDSLIEIQFHLIDDYGVYYYGAGSEEWKKLWCNLLIVKPDGSILRPDEFKIIEYNQGDGNNLAASLVLDHSGSMGNQRAIILQKGVRALIESKRENDGLSLVKFDNYVLTVSKLTKNKSELLKNFGITGLQGFGGGTALLDAINVGISNLNNARNYDEKAIIVFTDGNENFSLATQKEVILRATENNIKIHTIGYGDFISEDYLKAIADHTGGSYYRLFDEEQLSWIFEDVYSKGRNYYGMRIKPFGYGEYRFFIKLCPPKGDPDTLTFTFYYQPSVSVNSSIYDSLDFQPLIKNIKPNEFYKNEINFPDIREFDKITVIKPQSYQAVEEETDTINMENVDYEFNNLVFPDIKFVFDKTEIVNGTDREIVNVIEFMKKYPRVVLEVAGHTDEKGSHAYNQELSERRAEKVRQIIISAGIQPERVVAIGYGKKLPVATNETESGRQANRRVEFRIIEY